MQDFLTSHGEMTLIFLFVILLTGVAITPVVYFLAQWRRVRLAEIEAKAFRAELEAALKRDMLERGMSADDIRKVFLIAPEEKPASSELEAALADFLHQTEAAKAGAGAAQAGVDARPWEELGKAWGKFGKLWARCSKGRSCWRR
jgi:hypothetical protein